MMYALVDDFMKQYELSKILAAEMSRRSFGQLGAFSLHSFGVFHVYSGRICNNEMPPIKLLMDCLVGRYALPVVYYVAGWTLYSASKASTIVTDKRPLYFTWAASQTIHEQQILQIVRCLLWRGRNGGCWSIAHTIILTLCVLLRVFFLPIQW